jgi:hypothetical protein
LSAWSYDDQQGVFIVSAASGSDFTLFDTDSSSYNTYTSGGTFDEAAFGDLCELTNYNRTGGTSPEIPATTICSTAQEYELGLPDFGTTAIDYNFAPETAVQTALHDFYISGAGMAARVILPNDGGNMVLLGFVQQESELAGVGGLWTGSTTAHTRFDH